MDARQSRRRPAYEASRKGNNELNLKDQHILLQAVIIRLNSIENDMKIRVRATEESLDQFFLTFFGFVHPCHRLLYYHSP